ncbi:MAG TPA: hypothetical protein DDZ68_10755 [Parvularcula sp.]|nr:hypothetical protein [Parvularcula sp.]HBS33302.1 hypothetical protein [Parvularcula sp.]HBS35699.1 hypothetical protein [Parvularcula sp.]
MGDFSYKALDAIGAVVSGEIAAQSREEALAKIRAKGLVPFKAAPSRRSGISSVARGAGPARLARKSAAHFYRQLAVLLGADLRIDQALAIVERLISRKRESSIIGQMRAKVREGRSLSLSMQDFSTSFRPIEISLFRNGELRGDIAGAAATAADLLERSMAVRARLISAMIYPAILSFAALGALLVVTLVLAPTVLPMYERSGQDPPAAFAALISFSRLLKDWWWALGLSAAMFALWAVRAVREAKTRTMVDGLLLRVPILGEAIANNEAARMTRTLAALLNAGAPLPGALEEAAGVLSNSVFQAHFRASRERVRKGESLSDAIAGLQRFPSPVYDFIVIGETTGRLSEMLAHAADYAESSATRSIDRAMTALSPLLTLLMGFLVGSLIAIVLSAILGANELLLG